MTNKNILVTGGAGFIGSAVIRYLINETNSNILNIDKLTYAGNLESLETVSNNPRYQFLHADICDKSAMTKAFQDFQPNIVMHLAAESLVDNCHLEHVDTTLNYSNTIQPFFESLT